MALERAVIHTAATGEVEHFAELLLNNVNPPVLPRVVSHLKVL